MGERIKETTRFFRSHGFKTTILKGHGIAQLYPKPERRQCGDVDIWLVPKADAKGARIEKKEKRKEKDGNAREVIYQFARENDPQGKLHGVNYHHVHYHLFDDTEVELHIYSVHHAGHNERNLNYMFVI